MSVNEKMTAINDQIRTLSGKTGVMGLDAMANNISDANTEVNTQTNIIEQIEAALEGKAGGGSAGASIETCTITLNLYFEAGYTTYSDSTGMYSTVTTDKSYGREISVAKGTSIYIDIGPSYAFTLSDGMTLLYQGNGSIIAVASDAPDVGTISASYVD